MVLDQLLEQDFIRVTEQAAIAAAKTMGFGDRRHSDQVAVEAMRKEMDTLPMSGRVVIGEGGMTPSQSFCAGRRSQAHAGLRRAGGYALPAEVHRFRRRNGDGSNSSSIA